MESKLITVIMSVYNAKEYLITAIESVLNQEYRNLEFIIVNDGSTDKSLEVIKYYMQLDSRIILIDQENKGLTRSLNIAIQRAKGYYIARQDSDDVSLSNRFVNFMRFIELNGSVALYSTPAKVINEKGEVQKTIPNFFRRNGFNQNLLNYYNSMIHGTLIIRSRILKEYKYDEKFYYSQDFELYHRLMKNDFKISYDNSNVSYLLRHHKDAITSKNGNSQNNLFKFILEQHNKKYYKPSIFNRFFFRMKDFQYFMKAKLYNK